MTIEGCWGVLDSGTRRWLVENPGSVVLPRTVVNAINAARDGELPADAHGEFVLSARDQEFIVRRARQSGIGAD
jgi:hypothetical protein